MNRHLQLEEEDGIKNAKSTWFLCLLSVNEEYAQLQHPSPFASNGFYNSINKDAGALNYTLFGVNTWF